MAAKPATRSKKTVVTAVVAYKGFDTGRLSDVKSLAKGAHDPSEGAMCVMEAVAYVAREKWSDEPECVCPVISTFLRSWNDALPDDERTALLLPLIPRLIGTRNPALEERRSLMAADWLARVHTPAWLRLAKLDTHAETLERLPEITSLAQAPSLRGPLEAVRRDAAAKLSAAKLSAAKLSAAKLSAAKLSAAAWADAGSAAARAAAWAAAGAAAAMAAARAAARAAAWADAWADAMAAARAAARAAAWADAWADAWAAAGAALADTRKRLQASAVELVIRMCEVSE